jgi:hypothetical protein
MLENIRVFMESLLPETLPQRIALYLISLAVGLLAATVFVVAG